MSYTHTKFTKKQLEILKYIFVNMKSRGSDYTRLGQLIYFGDYAKTDIAFLNNLYKYVYC